MVLDFYNVLESSVCTFVTMQPFIFFDVLHCLKSLLCIYVCNMLFFFFIMLGKSV